MKRLLLPLLCGLLLCLGAPRAHADDAWAALKLRAQETGMGAAEAGALVGEFADRGIAPGEAASILGPLFEAGGQGLPTRLLRAKIEEGFRKRVEADALARAVATRRAFMGRAHALLSAAQYPLAAREAHALLESATLALESGLDEGVIQLCLETGRGKEVGQVEIAVEAAETLHLEGLDKESVGVVVKECLERNLRRTEVIRVVRLSRERYRQGMTGEALLEGIRSGGELRGSPGGREGGDGGRPGGSSGMGGPGGSGGVGGGNR